MVRYKLEILTFRRVPERINSKFLSGWTSEQLRNKNINYLVQEYVLSGWSVVLATVGYVRFVLTILSVLVAVFLYVWDVIYSCCVVRLC